MAFLEDLFMSEGLLQEVPISRTILLAYVNSEHNQDHYTVLISDK